jgi:hypothetical protein
VCHQANVFGHILASFGQCGSPVAMLHPVKLRFAVGPYDLLFEDSDSRQRAFDSMGSHVRSWLPCGTLLPWTPHAFHPASLNSVWSCRASVRGCGAGASSAATCPWSPPIGWRALSRWGTHQHGLCGIDGQSGDQQAFLQTPAGAGNPMRGASPITDPHACVE